MGWATGYIEELKQGVSVEFRPRGNSMEGVISSGQLVRVEPVGQRTLHIGDIVLCKVGGVQYLHLVSGLKLGQCQISNNKGHVNGWTSTNQIYGVVVKVY